jgi:hypothetical protein
MADKDDLTPEQRIDRAEEQKREAASRRSEVDRLFNRLSRHLADNHFAERLYAQLDASRRTS